MERVSKADLSLLAEQDSSRADLGLLLQRPSSKQHGKNSPSSDSSDNASREVRDAQISTPDSTKTSSKSTTLAVTSNKTKPRKRIGSKLPKLKIPAGVVEHLESALDELDVSFVLRWTVDEVVHWMNRLEYDPGVQNWVSRYELTGRDMLKLLPTLESSSIDVESLKLEMADYARQRDIAVEQARKVTSRALQSDAAASPHANPRTQGYIMAALSSRRIIKGTWRADLAEKDRVAHVTLLLTAHSTQETLLELPSYMETALRIERTCFSDSCNVDEYYRMCVEKRREESEKVAQRKEVTERTTSRTTESTNVGSRLDDGSSSQSMFIHYTLSEDFSGPQDSIISQKLARLGEKSRMSCFGEPKSNAWKCCRCSERNLLVLVPKQALCTGCSAHINRNCCETFFVEGIVNVRWPGGFIREGGMNSS